MISINDNNCITVLLSRIVLSTSYIFVNFFFHFFSFSVFLLSCLFMWVALPQCASKLFVSVLLLSPHLALASTLSLKTRFFIEMKTYRLLVKVWFRFILWKLVLSSKWKLAELLTLVCFIHWGESVLTDEYSVFLSIFVFENWFIHCYENLRAHFKFCFLNEN